MEVIDPMKHPIHWQELGNFPGSVIAMGNFDGVHLGHQSILKILKDLSVQQNLPFYLLTYEPHPQFVLNPQGYKAITSFSEKLFLLSQFGLDHVISLKFQADLQNLEPEFFLQEVLCRRLQAKYVVIGENHRFGKGGRGDINLLRQVLSAEEVEVIVAPSILEQGEKVSSSRIRKLLETGDIKKANTLLGHAFSYEGEVVKGDGLARTLGFPTANLSQIAPPKILVKSGVYGGRVIYEGNTYRALINIGKSPTFQVDTHKIEAFLLDFDHKIYGQKIKIILESFLRPEIKFQSKEDLVKQIKQDVVNFQTQES